MVSDSRNDLTQTQMMDPVLQPRARNSPSRVHQRCGQCRDPAPVGRTDLEDLWWLLNQKFGGQLHLDIVDLGGCNEVSFRKTMRMDAVRIDDVPQLILRKKTPEILEVQLTWQCVKTLHPCSSHQNSW